MPEARDHNELITNYMIEDKTVLITEGHHVFALPLMKRLLARWKKSHIVVGMPTSLKDDGDGAEILDLLREWSPDRVVIRTLDMGSLESIHSFANGLVQYIATGVLPSLGAMISFSHRSDSTSPGNRVRDEHQYPSGVDYITHAALTLRLLGSFGKSGGRVLFVSGHAQPSNVSSRSNGGPSNLHGNPNNAREAQKISCGDIDPLPRWFSSSEEVVATWTHTLNNYLQQVITKLAMDARPTADRMQDRQLFRVAAIIMDPGTRGDSGANPQSASQSQRGWRRSARRRHDDQKTPKRTLVDVANDIAGLALSRRYATKRGRFIGTPHVESSAESVSSTEQQELWRRTYQMANSCTLASIDEGFELHSPSIIKTSSRYVAPRPRLRHNCGQILNATLPCIDEHSKCSSATSRYR